MVLKMGTKMMSTKPLIKMKPAVLLFLISFLSGSLVLKMDILAAMPLEKLDAMTIQSELKKLAEVK